MLFHVSEEPGIEQFLPRPSGDQGEALVWAIDAERLRNYLVPRDCPRVTYYAGPRTREQDIAAYLGSSAAVVAIERAWLGRLRSCRLYCYHLPPDTFERVDDCAGYAVSREAVIPVRVDMIDDAIGELRRRDVELRVLPNLWTLHDAVVASTLRFSMIRMRNALPRSAA